MNCPKCGSPLNPGDKFCQVCGSAVEVPNQAAPVEQPVAQPQPAPMPTPQPVQQPMPQPQPAQMAAEPKKGGNTLVVVLVGVIAVLVVAIVAILFLGKGKEESTTGGNSGTDPTTVAKKEEPKYNEVTVGNIKFKLMSGYSVQADAQGVLLSNANYTSQAMVSLISGHNVTDLDAVSTQMQFKQNGFESTSKEVNIEGKQGVLFTGKYKGYDYEVIYLQESPLSIIVADILYKTPTDFTNDAENIHKMLALASKVDATTNAETKTFGNFSSTFTKK